MARALAAMGFVVLRFDFSGIGDSAVRYDNLPFDKSAVRETQDAMRFLEATRGVGRFILLGGCSGARISLQTACCDPRVVGAFLINLQMTENEDQNSDHITRSAAFYYWNFALFNFKSWCKLLTGKADYRNILRALGFQARTQFASGGKMSAESIQLAANLRMLAERGACVTFLYAECDPRLNDLREAVGRELKQLRTLGNVRVQIIPRSDHTFSSLHDQEKLLKEICELIDSVTPVTAGAPLNQHHDQLPQSVQETLPQHGGNSAGCQGTRGS